MELLSGDLLGLEELLNLLKLILDLNIEPLQSVLGCVCVGILRGLLLVLIQLVKGYSKPFALVQFLSLGSQGGNQLVGIIWRESSLLEVLEELVSGDDLVRADVLDTVESKDVLD